MSIKKSSWSLFLLTILFFSCNDSEPPPPAPTDIAETPEQLIEKTEDNIRKNLDFAAAHNGKLSDSFLLQQTGLMQTLYKTNQYAALWSNKEQWKPAGDSLLDFIRNAKLYGLFPLDYHLSFLDSVRKEFDADTLSNTSRKNAALWAKTDILLTDAFLHIVKDVKLGHLPQDSISLRKDSVLVDSFYVDRLNEVLQGATLSSTIDSLEPRHEGYQLIKAGIKGFLDSAKYKSYTNIPSSKDSLFKQALQKRLYEDGYIAFDSVRADSAQLVTAIKKFQKKKGITVDGVAGEGTVRLLNTTDEDRFMSIVISMDRYKLLPPKMPEKYIWVNLPSFYLRLQDNDTVRLVSKIVCGKTKTRTPLLTSAISEIITYPQWTVPQSIIVKEMLPTAKKDPGYFAKKGLSLVDAKGEEIDPFTVNWSKYSKGIPYKVVQGSGDANALGVLKFNFPNKYAVYLHDTNQRSLFGAPVRTLSHGCVRVQEWEKLAVYLIRNNYADTATVLPALDSMNSWLSRKEKHGIPMKKRVPVFIRYFTCEGKDNGLVFYDDIYGEDRLIREKYYAGK
ncbi:MAG TPA: L,D-transpeptidase family protein [Chitinophagaceae bacterium]